MYYHREIDDMMIPNINEQFHLYPILLIASLVIGLLIPSIKLSKAGIRKDILLCVALLNMFLALFFGKVYTMIAEKNTDLLRTGFSSLGGLVGFLIGIYIFYLICDKDKRILENYVISLPLIYAISKIGCFLAGCCHGIEYTGIFNVRYEADSACEVMTGVFPVQMAETIVFIVLYFILYTKKRKENIVTMTLVLSAVAKFTLDFFRYSHVRKLLSFNQIVCLIIVVVCILYRVGELESFRGQIMNKIIKIILNITMIFVCIFLMGCQNQNQNESEILGDYSDETMPLYYFEAAIVNYVELSDDTMIGSSYFVDEEELRLRVEIEYKEEKERTYKHKADYFFFF